MGGGGAAVTAPRPLPPCPVCKRRPSEWECHNGKGRQIGWCIACEPYTRDEATHHCLYVVTHTRAATRRAWRRIAR